MPDNRLNSRNEGERGSLSRRLLDGLRPGVQSIGVCLLLLSGTVAMGQQREADKLLVNAMQAQQRGDLPAAIRDYQKLLQLSPHLNDARVNLGAALSQSGRFDEAITQYRLAMPAMPDNIDLRRDLALAYYKKGDLSSAIREFHTLHERQPEDVQIAILLGDS